jgi:hypothetical protein
VALSLNKILCVLNHGGRGYGACRPNICWPKYSTLFVDKSWYIVQTGNGLRLQVGYEHRFFGYNNRLQKGDQKWRPKAKNCLKELQFICLNDIKNHVIHLVKYCCPYMRLIHQSNNNNNMAVVNQNGDWRLFYTNCTL